jgi:hypothetical protein
MRCYALRGIRVSILCWMIALVCATAATAGPAQKRRARLREYKVPIGSLLPVQLRMPIGSVSSRPDDQVDAVLVDPIIQNGVELIPAGSIVHGRVVEAVPAVNPDERGLVSIAFAVVQHRDTKSRAAIKTRTITIEAEPPPPPPSKKRKRQDPVNVELDAGYPLELTLSAPLLVFIPAAR